MEPVAALEGLIYGSDLFGTAVFAVSGVVAAGRQRMDPFGVLVLATVTAIGGGTIRDLVIGAERVFWVTDPTYLYVILLTALVSMLIMVRAHRFSVAALPLFDAFGLAVFTMIGTQKALGHGTSAAVAVMMGVVTGVAGGMIRDLLAGSVPLVLKREIYATASFCGGALYALGVYFSAPNLLSIALCVSAVLLLRLYSIRKHLSLPTFDPEEV